MGRWEFAARHHMTASDAESCTVGDLLELEPGAQNRLLGLELKYVPTWGTDELREAVAATYDTLSAADVLAFAGAEEGLFWALSEALAPGDHAIVTVPNYQSMESVSRATGADVEGLVLRAENAFAPDPGELERMLRPSTKVVCLNFPNNPTGAVPARDVFEDIVRACDRRGVRVFSDEVYRGLELDQAHTLVQAADLSERAISLNVTSKAYGLPGLRVGWLASRDREFLARVERRKHYTSICNAAPSELLAAIAIRHGETLKSRCRDLVRHNAELATRFFAKWPSLFEWSAPQGGCVCFPRYRGQDGVETFAEALLREQGVLVLPASVYRSELGQVPPDRFRLGIGRRDAEAGFAAIDRHLRLPRGPAVS